MGKLFPNSKNAKFLYLKIFFLNLKSKSLSVVLNVNLKKVHFILIIYNSPSLQMFRTTVAASPWGVRKGAGAAPPPPSPRSPPPPPVQQHNYSTLSVCTHHHLDDKEGIPLTRPQKETEERACPFLNTRIALHLNSNG